MAAAIQPVGLQRVSRRAQRELKIGHDLTARRRQQGAHLRQRIRRSRQFGSGLGLRDNLSMASRKRSFAELERESNGVFSCIWRAFTCGQFATSSALEV